jgi:hypothetical protein
MSDPKFDHLSDPDPDPVIPINRGVNLPDFKGYDPGTVRLDPERTRARRLDDGTWDLSFVFLYRPGGWVEVTTTP